MPDTAQQHLLHYLQLLTQMEQLFWAGTGIKLKGFYRPRHLSYTKYAKVRLVRGDSIKYIQINTNY